MVSAENWGMIVVFKEILFFGNLYQISKSQKYFIAPNIPVKSNKETDQNWISISFALPNKSLFDESIPPDMLCKPLKHHLGTLKYYPRLSLKVWIALQSVVFVLFFKTKKGEKASCDLNNANYIIHSIVRRTIESVCTAFSIVKDINRFIQLFIFLMISKNMKVFSGNV